MNKLITGAVATAMVAPVAAFAAIDEQGMQYVSAGEGLGGSLRVDVLYDVSDDANTTDPDVTSKTNSLRLWAAGDADLGGGMAATYYIELRNSGNHDHSGNPGEDSIYVDAYDIGLRGPFGHVAVGHLGMVAPRMVPGASLAYERGTNREAFAADPGPNGIRYESPVINGFQFGASGRLDGSGGPDGSLDEFSLAVKYTLPVGLQLGAGFAQEDVTATAAMYTGGLSGAGDVFAGAASETGNLTDTTVDRVAAFAAARDHDSMSGFRVGARYGMDNWLVAYEYRGYDGFKPSNIANYSLDSQGVVVHSTNDRSAGTDLEAMLDGWIVNGDEGLEYAVHAVGVQAKIDRFTMSAGYSIEENTYEGSAVVSGGEITLERDTIAIDAAYSLGSKSALAVGWKSEDYSSTVNPFGNAGATVTGSREKSETYLFYRVDF